MPRRDPFTNVCRQFAAIKSRRLADLHAHTTASDGDSTPSQFVALARNANLAAIAITDHDTTAGVAEAMAMGATFASPNLAVVPGVELSVSFRNREIHVLGLFVDPTHPELNRACEEMCRFRKERFRGYFGAIAELGRAIPQHFIDHIEATATSLGRRHIASLLVQSGIAPSHYAAFQNVMSTVSDRVPPKKLLAIDDAISLVRQAGGLSILAHPPGEFDEAVYEELASLGLDGIETRHPSASNLQTDFLVKIAKRHSWLVSAGSDYHGPTAGGRSLGQFGATPDEYTNLTSRIDR